MLEKKKSICESLNTALIGRFTWKFMWHFTCHSFKIFEALRLKIVRPFASHGSGALVSRD